MLELLHAENLTAGLNGFATFFPNEPDRIIRSDPQRINQVASY